MSSFKEARGFGAAEVERLLRAVDRHLARSATLVIIGGGAAAFHQARSTTSDIDTTGALEEHLRAAIAAASAETGLFISIGPAADA